MDNHPPAPPDADPTVATHLQDLIVVRAAGDIGGDRHDSARVRGGQQAHLAHNPLP